MPVNSYTCPYCQHDIVLQDEDVDESEVRFQFSDDRVRYGRTGLQLISYACPNQNCREFAITVSWHELRERRATNQPQYGLGKRLEKWQLLKLSKIIMKRTAFET